MELIFNELSTHDHTASIQRLRSRRKTKTKRSHPQKTRGHPRKKAKRRFSLALTPPTNKESARRKMTLLGQTLREAFALGVSRVLRTTQEFYHSKIAEGYLISDWGNDPQVDREEKRFIKSLAAKAPFIAQLHQAEEATSTDAYVQKQSAKGIGLAHLRKHAVISLCERPWNKENLRFKSLSVIQEELSEEELQVRNWFEPQSPIRQADWLSKILQAEITSGPQLIQRQAECLARLIILSKAEAQLKQLTGSEKVFSFIKQHLFALHLHALRCPKEEVFILRLPLDATDEGQSKRQQFANQLTFTCEDQVARLFSFHSKIRTDGWRIYFMPTGTGKVRIAYIGEHL